MESAAGRNLQAALADPGADVYGAWSGHISTTQVAACGFERWYCR